MFNVAIDLCSGYIILNTLFGIQDISSFCDFPQILLNRCRILIYLYIDRDSFLLNSPVLQRTSSYLIRCYTMLSVVCTMHQIIQCLYIINFYALDIRTVAITRIFVIELITPLFLRKCYSLIGLQIRHCPMNLRIPL